jgi:hypothetical protein
MDTTFLGLPWFVWGLLSLVVAAVYAAAWPRRKSAGILPARPVWRHVVLRWFHPLVWVQLAVSCFVRPSQAFGGSATANVLALLALATYAIFVGTLLFERMLRR